MKKAISILFAMMLLISMSTTAFADEYEETLEYNEFEDTGAFDEYGNTVDLAFPETGVTFHIPWEMFNAEGFVGTLSPLITQEIGYHSGIYMTQLMYEREEEIFDPEAYAPYLTVLCIRDEHDENVLNDPGFLEMIPGQEVNPLVYTDGCQFYVRIGTESLPEKFTEEEIYWYQYLLEYADEIINNADYYAPGNPEETMNGDQVSFQTMDLEGNPVSSEELFADNQITMLNIWETGCGSCRGELADLARIHEDFQQMGCGIVGLLWDSDMPGAVDEAKQLLQDAYTTYPTIQSPSNFEDIFEINAFPTSYFIDSSGTILGSIKGAEVDYYEEVLLNILTGGEEIESDYTGSQSLFMNKVGAIQYTGKAASEPTPGTPYRIICVDEDENPVQGATVQFCSEEQCMIEKTDEDGVAEFDAEPGSYTVHLLKVPEGYAQDSTEYEVPSIPDEITIIVRK